MTTTTSQGCGCEESQRLTVSRRGVLTSAAIAGAGAMVFGDTFVRAHAAPPGAPDAARLLGTEPVLVVVSLRGAADGMSLVVPHGDPNYYKARPNIAIPAASLLAPDAMFGLHPQLAALADWWRLGKVAAVHAAGLPAPNRSHFAAMEEVEDADPGSADRVGWLNRLLGADTNTSPLQGLHLGGSIPPTSLAGPQLSMAVPDPGSVTLAADGSSSPTARRRSLAKAWGNHPGVLGTSARAVPGLVDAFKPASATKDVVKYPESSLAKGLSFTSRVIRSGVGAQVLTVDHGGWDMHTNLGTLAWGEMKSLTADLSASLAAFLSDLGTHLDRVTVVILSEFGRRTVENSNYGLDHGYGNVMLLAGAGVNGGRVHGTWPGLTLGSDSDLLVTTDYRSVLAEVVRTRFGVTPAQVFPGFTPAPVGAMTG